MEPLAISTPALLFPAITILILTYSNRFSTLSNKIREFIRKGEDAAQIAVFRRRVGYVRRMLLWGILGLAASALSMLALVFKCTNTGVGLFVLADLSIVISLIYAILDVSISTNALELEVNGK